MNVHVLAVLSVTRTFGDTRGQFPVPRSSGSGQFAGPVESSTLTLRPLGLSHRHLQVGVGTDEVATSDGDSDMNLDYARNMYLHHETVV